MSEAQTVTEMSLFASYIPMSGGRKDMCVDLRQPFLVLIGRAGERFGCHTSAYVFEGTCYCSKYSLTLV